MGPDGKPANRKPRATFAARSNLNQGDIIHCEPEFRVSGSRRSFTELHEAILLQKHDLTATLLREKPRLCKVKDEGGNMPIHLAAQIVTPSEIVGMIIDAYPEALVIRNHDGFFPGTLAQQTPDQSRDVRNMLQDGRTQRKGNWVYDRYESERHTHAVEWCEARDQRKQHADAVRPTVAGYVQPRNQQVFLSAHESAR